MPIAQVLLSDSFAVWFAKTNDMISKVNALAVQGSILSVTAPQPAQLLMWDGSFFRNVALSGDVTVNANGVMSVVSTSNGVQKGRLMHASSIRSVF